MTVSNTFFGMAGKIIVMGVIALTLFVARPGRYIGQKTHSRHSFFHIFFLFFNVSAKSKHRPSDIEYEYRYAYASVISAEDAYGKINDFYVNHKFSKCQIARRTVFVVFSSSLCYRSLFSIHLLGPLFIRVPRYQTNFLVEWREQATSTRHATHTNIVR